MRGRRAFLGAAALAPLLWHSRQSQAVTDPSRVALVVGNNGYRQVPLQNAINDAKGMAALLSQAGFAVDLRLDVARGAFVEAVDRFGKAAAGPEISTALFYYAGHGLQINWKNYLVPIDADVASGADLAAACVDFDLLLRRLAGVKNKTLVVILDACRDNPLGDAYRPAQKGLSPFDAPAGSLIAYATAPGKVASDGSGDHGLYTENLIRELSVREQRIEDALKRVRISVRLATRGSQVPWESTSLETDVFLFPAARKQSEAEVERQFEEELADWNRTKASRNVEDWVAYLRRYPRGKFSELAQARLNKLLAAIEPALVAAAPPQLAPVEIEAGKPLPKLWVPSDNPYSAGTYALGRTYTVGDETTFRDSDLMSGAEVRVFTLRVTRVDLAADRVEFNDGEWICDTMGNMQKMGRFAFELPVQIFPAELQVGKKWSTRFKQAAGAPVDVADVEYRVAGVERITVAAGVMHAFRINGEGWFRNGRQIRSSHWVVPGVNAIYVNREFTIRAQNGQWIRTERTELVSHRQAA